MFLKIFFAIEMYSLNGVSDIEHRGEKGSDSLISFCQEMFHRVNKENHKQFWGEMLKDISDTEPTEEKIISRSILQPIDNLNTFVLFDKHSCPRDARTAKIISPNKTSIYFPICLFVEKDEEGHNVDLFVLQNPGNSKHPLKYGELYKSLNMKVISSLEVLFI